MMATKPAKIVSSFLLRGGLMVELSWIETPIHHVELDEPLAPQYAEAPDDIVGRGRELLRAVLAELPNDLRYLADAVRIRTLNRFHREFAALAAMIDADWRDLVLANISYDLTLAAFGCSTVALPTVDGPVVARNMDWWPEKTLARSSCLMRYLRGGEFQFANAGWPGAVGVVTGMAREFAVVLNAVAAPDEGPNRAGYPMLLFLRRVLEDAGSFDKALAMLSKTKLTTSGLITLVGRENDQRVVVERSSTRFALRWAEGDAPLVTTNDYRLLFPPQQREGGEIYQTACRRFEHLSQFFANHDPQRKVSNEELLYVLTDQQVRLAITAQHILMRPRTGQVAMYVPRKFVI